jgi:hypothetical protein
MNFSLNSAPFLDDGPFGRAETIAAKHCNPVNEAAALRHNDFVMVKKWLKNR